MGSPRQRQRAAAAGVQAAAAAATGAQQQQAKGSTAAGMEKEGRGAVASSSSGWFGWVRWLGAEEGHPKHLGWLHPLAACLLVTASTVFAVVRLADALQPPPASTHPPHPEQLYAAVGLAGYTAVLLGARVVATGSYALYEFLWACNIAMLLAALGLFTRRPLLVAAGAVAVSIDQGLWYVDVLGFLLTLGRRFPVGVAKYLTWPQTSWARRITSTHHLWFMPYCLVFSRKPWPLMAFPLSVAFVAVLDVQCRFVTPFCLQAQATTPSPTAAGSVHAGPPSTRRRSLRLQQQQQQQQRGGSGDDGTAAGARYLNVNLVYELWKDIDVAFLKVSHPHPAVHLTRLVVLWSLLNVPFALLLFPLSRALSAASASSS